MKVKRVYVRYPSREREFCDVCQVHRASSASLRRHVQSISHRVQVYQMESRINEHRQPPRTSPEEPIIVDSTNDDDANPPSSPIVWDSSAPGPPLDVQEPARRRCFRCNITVSANGYHNHVTSAQHMRNGMSARRRRLGTQLTGSVEKLVVNFEAARAVSRLVRRSGSVKWTRLYDFESYRPADDGDEGKATYSNNTYRNWYTCWRLELRRESTVRLW